MDEVTTKISKRIEIRRDIVRGLKANLDYTENKLIIAIEKQIDYLLEKLTMCQLDSKDMRCLKDLGDLVIQLKKLSKSDDEATIVNNLNVTVDELKALASGKP